MQQASNGICQPARHASCSGKLRALSHSRVTLSTKIGSATSLGLERRTPRYCGSSVLATDLTLSTVKQWAVSQGLGNKYRLLCTVTFCGMGCVILCVTGQPVCKYWVSKLVKGVEKYISIYKLDLSE